MHSELIRKYLRYQALTLAVIAPHWSEHIWLSVLGEKSSIQLATYLTDTPAPRADLAAAREYVRNTSAAITSAEGAQLKKMAKGKTTSYDIKSDKRLTIYCAREYPAWQAKYVDMMRDSYPALDMKALSQSVDKADAKRAMPFMQALKRALDGGADAEDVFARKLGFDEVDVLRELAPGLRQSVTKCVAVDVVVVHAGTGKGEVVAVAGGESKVGDEVTDLAPTAEAAVPGQPTFYFVNVQG